MTRNLFIGSRMDNICPRTVGHLMSIGILFSISNAKIKLKVMYDNRYFFAFKFPTICMYIIVI